MRKVALLVTAVAVACFGVVGVSSAINGKAGLKISVSPSKVGTKTKPANAKLFTDITTAPAADDQPFATKATVVHLDKNFVFKGKNAKSCSNSQVLSDQTKCPSGSKLGAGKDASDPTNIFARAQLMAQDDPKAALALLDTKELKAYPAAMQDDVAILKTQLYLGMGRTQDARKVAETINLENPSRKEMRTMAAVIVAEAFARTGKPKEALALVESIELPKKDADQILVQARVVKVFAKFAMNQRPAARAELVALADDDVNYLGRFLMPQFKVHPELQKLARQVLEANPAARKVVKGQQRR